MTAALSLGVAGALGPAAVAEIARLAESAGFAALWVNDTPDGDALVALAAAATATTRLGLATGVLPVDRRRPHDIAAAVADLPVERLRLGIGSGAVREDPVGAVRAAIEALRSETKATIVVGALGPRMRRLAAEQAAGPLLSWLSPETAGAHAAESHVIRPASQVSLYVRAALDPAAGPRLSEETGRYASFPNYAANFARLDLDPGDTVLDEGSAPARLPAYRRAVDEVVLRAITPTDDLREYARFVELASPLVGRGA